MKKGWISVLIVAILFISSCAPQQQEEQKVVCNRPYILSGDNCCLDINSNNICDNQESEYHVSSESIVVSKDSYELSCPKEVVFSTTESPNTRVNLFIKAKYTGFGDESFRPAFFCDDGSVPTVSPLTLVLSKDVEQSVKTYVTLSPKTCTFSLIVSSDSDKFVSCIIPVRAV